MINGKDMPLTYMDKYKLEGAVSEWYKSVPLKQLQLI